jgi:chemotaxis protein histidine kinase CheA
VSGRGLGFRVVRELVAISGGCLNVESQVDVGTSIPCGVVRGEVDGGGDAAG